MFTDGMIEAWKESPGFFIALGSILLVTLIAFLLALLKNRSYRHIERMRAMELDRVAESFFAGRLLNYVPWQFWTSFAILLVLVFSSFIAQETNTKQAFLELSKYVTGAVIGSLFGNSPKLMVPI